MLSKKVLAVGTACAVAAAFVAVAAGGPLRDLACKPGVISYGGARAIVYCGPAKAAAQTKTAQGPITLRFAQGHCEKRQRYLRVDIGTRMLSAPNKPKPDYFQLVIGSTPGSNELPVSKDGKYKDALITVIKGGAEYLPDGTRGTVTLQANRTKGLFSGKSGSGQVVSGSFVC
jgi:hypothetical protein